jgi:predicted DNA-binding transcriptional regulator AlpA
MLTQRTSTKPELSLRVEDEATLLDEARSPVYRAMKAGTLALPVARTGHDQIAAVDLISIPETARRIGLHADTLYRLCRTGHFPPAIQIGGRWKVSIPRLERYLHGKTTDS